MAFAYPRLTPRVRTPPISPGTAANQGLPSVGKPGAIHARRPGERPPSATSPSLMKPGLEGPGGSSINVNQAAGILPPRPMPPPKFGPPGMVSQAAGPPKFGPPGLSNDSQFWFVPPKPGFSSQEGASPSYGIPKFGPPVSRNPPMMGPPPFSPPLMGGPPLMGPPPHGPPKFGPPESGAFPSFMGPPGSGAFPSKLCEFCKATKPAHHFYTYITCSAHSNSVCYACIKATKAKYCPACPREYSQQERELLRLKLAV